MEKPKVLLRKEPTGSFHEVGLVLSRQGKRLTLQMPDGSTLEHQLVPRDEMTPDQGSFHHVLRTAPEAVAQALSDRPERIFKQLLHESKKALGARDLKDRLQDFPTDLVDRAWTVAKPILDQDADVDRHGPDGLKYGLHSNVTVDLLDLLPPTAEPAVRGDGGTPKAAASGPVEGETCEKPKAPLTDEPGPRTTPAAAAAPVVELASRLSALPDLDVRDLADVSRHPLTVGARVNRLSGERQQELVTGLPSEQRRLLALVAGPLRRDALVEETVLLRSKQYDDVLQAGVRELMAAPKDGPDLTAALGTLMTRAHSQHVLGASTLVRLCVAFSSRAGGDTWLDEALTLLARRIDATGGLAPDFDLDSLARVVRTMPFSRDGARAALTSALYRTAPDVASARRWWEGATLLGLADASRVLARALDDPRVADHTVRPLVETHLREVSSRSGVSVLWGLPLPLAKHVRPSELKRAMTAAAERDPLLTSWLSTLSNADTVRSLEQEKADLTARVTSQQAEVDHATQEAERLRARLTAAGEQLAAARSAESGSREAHDRQIRIDQVRALAVVVAQVQQSEAARADQALMRQLDHACRREQLSALGAVGEQVAYDPQRHDSLEPSLVTGSAATVVRGGFTWDDNGQPLTLVKAQVVPA